MRKENIRVRRPFWKLGYRNFIRSTAITGKQLLENARQQGVRLLLAPMVGATGIAAFSTMRTGSNVALQGLNTIANPILPDLMRFLHDKDQLRSEAAFGTVWIVVVAIIAPAVIILQIFVEPIFNLWTQGRIPFNPSLFAILSGSVLVYAVSQPAIAVVVGNNLMRPQLVLSLIVAIVVIGGIILLVPTMGILGAGIALLAAEILSSAAYVFVASKWLNSQTLQWPFPSFWTATMSVLIAAGAMTLIILFPDAVWFTGLASLVLSVWNIIRYLRMLPEVVTKKLSGYTKNLPGIGKLFVSNL